jgi:hypothetical protein
LPFLAGSASVIMARKPYSPRLESRMVTLKA